MFCETFAAIFFENLDKSLGVFSICTLDTREKRVKTTTVPKRPKTYVTESVNFKIDLNYFKTRYISFQISATKYRTDSKNVLLMTAINLLSSPIRCVIF